VEEAFAVVSRKLWVAVLGFLVCLPLSPYAADPPLDEETLRAEEFPRRLTADSHLERLGAVRQILEGGVSERFLPELQSSLRDTDPAVRMVSAVALGTAPGAKEDVLSALQGALRDEDAQVRKYAAAGIGCLGSEAGDRSEALQAALQDRDPGVREEAELALREIAAEEEAARRGGASGVAVGRRPDSEKATRDADQPGTETATGETGPRRKPRGAGGGQGDAPSQRGQAAKPRPGGPVEALIAQLKAPNADARLQAAEALGKIGPDAKAAIPALEKARQDPDERVRRKAWWALNQILRPTTGTGGTGEPPEPVKPPETKAYFFPACQDVTPTEIIPRKIEGGRSDDHTAFIFGLTDLYCVDIAAMAKYRADAKRRGLDATAPLMKLIEADPKGMEYVSNNKVVFPYEKDHVIAIFCNGQLRFMYKRFDANGEEHRHGADFHLAMNTGKQIARVDVFTSDGFRLQRQVEFDFATDDDQLEINDLKQYRGPQDVAVEMRELISDPEKNTPEERARACLDIAGRVTYTAKRQIWDRSFRPQAALPYAKEALAFLRKARQLNPNVSLHTSTSMDLVQLCGMLNTQAGYSTGLSVMRLVENSMSGVSPASKDPADMRGWMVLTTCRRIMANMAIAFRNDIELFWFHAEEYLKNADKVRNPISGEALIDRTPEQERDTWPQRGWWRAEWDKLRPWELLHEEEDEAKDEGEDPKERARRAIAKLNETLEEIDRMRAADVRWVKTVRKAFAAAERRKAVVRGMLRVQAQMAAGIRHRITQLRKILAKAPEAESVTLLEAFFKFAIDKWDDAWGPPPKLAEDVKATIKRQIAELSQQHETILREQDELIKDTIETYYQGIILEVEAKGDKSAWKDVQKVSEKIKQDAREALALAKAELYLSSGQGDKFREASRGAREFGKYEAQVCMMEALHFHSKKDFRHAMQMYRRVMDMTAPKGETAAALTRDQAKITGEEQSMFERARKMVWTLEHAYLSAIDEKASGEAAAVRAKSAQRLKKGGEEGWFEWLKGHLKMGVVSATSAIVGREDALEGLASKYQQDVAAQHCGLLLAKSLHERGVPLDQIDGLSNEAFIKLVKSKFTKLKSDITPKQALRMRAAIKAAYQNPDMKRLGAQTKQMMNVDTGTPYFNSDEYNETALEWWGDIVNVWNVATMLGPMSTFKIGGKVQVTGNWGWIGGSKPAGSILTAKEAFARGIGLPKVVAAIGKTKAGKIMVGQFAKFFEKSGWLKDRALDATIQLAACKVGEATGGSIGVAMGSDGKAEAEAGRMFAELFTAWGAGDVDVMKKLMIRNHIAPKHLKGLIKAAEQIAESSEEAAKTTGKYVRQLNDVQPEVAEGGLSRTARKAVRRSMKEIQDEITDAARKFQAGEGTPELCRKIESLEAAYEGLAAADAGMLGQSKTWQDIVQEAADSANAEARLAAQQAKNLKQVSQQLQAAADETGVGRRVVKTGGVGAGPDAGVKTGVAPADKMPVELKAGSTLSKDVDQLVLDGDYQKAIANYERRLALLKQFGMGESFEAKDIAVKLRQTRAISAAHYRLSAADDAPNLRHADDIAPGEIEGMDANPEKYVKTRIAGTGGDPTYSDPYWVWEMQGDRAVKVGVFKGSGPDFPDGYDLRAEVLYYKIAKKIGVDVPACKIGTMTINGKKVKGLFVRMAPGAALEAYDNATHIALKTQLARDKTLAALLGDHDRRPANYLVSGKGNVTSIDHGMADPCGRKLGEAVSFADDDIAGEAMRTRIVGEGRVRQGLEYLDQHITIEDMRPTINKLKALFELEEGKYIERMLKSVLTPDEAADALRVLKRRLKITDGKLEEFFGTRPIPAVEADVPPVHDNQTARPGGDVLIGERTRHLPRRVFAVEGLREAA